MNTDNEGWIPGHEIPYTPDAVFDVFMDNGHIRKVRRNLSLDYSNLFYMDCTHPAQNAYCTQDQVKAWRVHK